MRRPTHSAVARLLGESAPARPKVPAVPRDQLDRLLGTLHEGTVIVLNSGADSPAQGDHAAILQQALTQLQQQSRSASPSTGPVSVPSNDRLQVEHGGKLWKFKINRDANGLITDLDVAESA